MSEENQQPGRVRTICVIGAGTMGSQIAMVCALSGFTTLLVDVAQDALDAAADQLHSRMDRDVAKGRRTAEDVAAAFDRLTATTDRDRAAPRADLVIEAVVEDLEIKRELFADLDRICPPGAILATNSSTIVSSRVASATQRPEKVCNLHFFNPALVMECVEVVPHAATSEATVETVTAVAQALGKQVVRLHQEVPGFVANRLLGALRSEALSLYEDGVADFEDIDIAARTALRHPMGPFELMDLVGIDVTYLIRMAEYEQTGDHAALPRRSVTQLYEAGRYGRKTGRGWYDYE